MINRVSCKYTYFYYFLIKQHLFFIWIHNVFSFVNRIFAAVLNGLLITSNKQTYSLIKIKKGNV